jgi:hypothetical protein
MQINELFQLLQLLYIFIVTLLLVRHIVLRFRHAKTLFVKVRDRSCSGTALLYSRHLYVMNYDSFYKYGIWRYYLHSRKSFLIS